MSNQGFNNQNIIIAGGFRGMGFELSKLYPNPFNPSTQISFSLPMDEYVKLAAYDIRGHEVDMIFEGSQSVGQHSYTWDASSLPSGVYFIRLTYRNENQLKKVLYLK